MDEIINFLLGNLVFVVAILWFLANVFRRQDPNNKENEPKRSNQQPGRAGPIGHRQPGRIDPTGRRESGGRPTAQRPEPDRRHRPEPRRGPLNPQPVPQPQTARPEPAPLPWETVANDSKTSRQDRQSTDVERSPLSERQQRLQQQLAALNKGRDQSSAKQGNEGGTTSDQLNRQDGPFRGGEPRSGVASEAPLNFEHLTQRRIVEGFVWSEIFNEPRAKRKTRGYLPYERRPAHRRR